MKKVLTIAGSDSGGGAGIQADLKTITVLGAYGMSVITAITAQNSLGVKAVKGIDPEIIEKQIDCIFEDFGADAVKTGMLSDAEIVGRVAKRLKEYRVKNLVVDPVMVAKSGDYLLDKKGRIALREKLLPLAFLIAPNLYEASELTGIRVDSLPKMKTAAKAISGMGAKNVLIKGGHLRGDAVDILYDGYGFHEFREKRIDTVHTHGVGCTLTAAIATFLARKYNLHVSIGKAKNYVTQAIKGAFPLGKGISPVNHFADIAQRLYNSGRFELLKEIKDAVEILKVEKISELIPEVGSNLAFCLPGARDFNDVGAVPGRIIKLNYDVITVAEPEFGASTHVGKIVLTLNRFDEAFRSAMNIKFTEEILKACKSLGFKIAEFSRKKEPKKVRVKEGKSLEWGVDEVLKRSGEMPDIIFDRGGIGKEAMIRVTGKDPADVANKVIRINRGLG